MSANFPLVAFEALSVYVESSYDWPVNGVWEIVNDAGLPFLGLLAIAEDDLCPATRVDDDDVEVPDSSRS